MGGEARIADTRVPGLVLVTDRRASDRPLLETVARALDAGLPAVQLRDKDLPGRELFRLAEGLREATRRAGALLFVNDRVDVAIAVDADGVHLGERALPVDVARALAPRALLVGASTHTVAAAAASHADFVFFGPVFETPSKRDQGPPQGEAALREAVAATPRPVLAIGGVDARVAARVRATGAHGMAVIRAILAADDPARATRELVAILR